MCADRCAGGSGACTPSRRGGKKVQVKVFLLDESVHTIQTSTNSLGSELYNATIERLKLLEADYFDLEYKNNEGHRCWLDHTKPIMRQVGSSKDMIFYLAVKFYTPYPNLLEEEYTRYLFALQIKRDLISGALTCSTNTMALLASFIVQAEIGDFIEEEYLDLSYMRPLKLLPSPNDELLEKVMDFHKQHIGMTPEEADFNLLDTSRKVEYYGVHMTPAKDHEGLSLSIAVTHLGVIVFQNLTKINTFSWAKIRKLSFKRKRFLIKLHPEGFGYYKDTVEFYFDSRDECKRFWKKCIEHHAFFRCLAAMKSSSKKPKVVSKGSSYRYIGRTQKELEEYVRENSTKRPPFERPSKRRTSKSPSGNRNAGGSHAYYPQQARPHSAHSQPIKTGRQTASSTASYNMDASVYSAPSRAVSEGDRLERNGADNSPPPTVAAPRSDVVDYRSEDEAAAASGKAKRRRSEQQQKLNNQKDAPPADVARESRESPDYPAPYSVTSNNIAKPGSRRQSSTSNRDSVRSNSSRHTQDSAGKQRDRTDMQAHAKIPNATNNVAVKDKRMSVDSPGSHNKSNNMQQQHMDSSKLIANKITSQPNNIDASTIGRIVCIDQYSSSDSDSLLGTRQPRSKSTPCSVHSNSIRESIRGKDKRNHHDPSAIADALDAETDLLLSDIPYVLLRRHISPDKTSRSDRSAGSGHHRAKKSPRSLASSGGHPRSMASQRTTSDGQVIRQSRSLDRKIAGLLPPKSPKLLREEYLQKQRNQVDHATIEALKAELRSAGQALSVSKNGRNRTHGGRHVVGRTTEFVSAYRLPAVNNFSAKDDTMSPQIESMALLYRKRQKKFDSNGDKIQTRNKRSSESLSDRSGKNLGDESPPCLPPRNPVYLDSTDSSDDSSCDRRSRPQSVSDVDVSLRTPRSARKQMLGDNDLPDETGRERGRKRLKKKMGMFVGAAHAARIAGSRHARDSENMEDDDISTEDEIESSWGSSFSSLDDQLSGVNVLQDEPDAAAVDDNEKEKPRPDVSETSSSSMRGQAESPSSSQPIPFPSEALSAPEPFPQSAVSHEEQQRPASRLGSKPLSSSTSGDELRVHQGHIDMSTASSSNGGLMGDEISSESDDAEFMVEERSRDPSISSQLDHMVKPDSVKSSGGSNSAASSEKAVRNKSRDSKPKKSTESSSKHMVPPGLMVTCPSPSPEPPRSPAQSEDPTNKKEVIEKIKSSDPVGDSHTDKDAPSKCDRQDSIDLDNVPFPEDQCLPSADDLSSIPLPDHVALSEHSEDKTAELAKQELSATLGELEKVTEEVLQSLVSHGDEGFTASQEASHIIQNSPVNYLAETSSNNLIGADSDNVTSIQSDNSSQAIDEVEPGATMLTVRGETPAEQFVGGPQDYPDDFDTACGSLTSTPSIKAEEEDVAQKTKFLAERIRGGTAESLGVLPEKMIEKEVALIEESCLDVASDTDVSCLATVSDSESASKYSPSSRADAPVVLQAALLDSPTRRNVAVNLVDNVIAGAINRLQEDSSPDPEALPKKLDISDSDSSPEMEVQDLASALQEELSSSNLMYSSQEEHFSIQKDSALPKRELSKVSEDPIEESKEEAEETRESDVSPLSPDAIDTCNLEQLNSNGDSKCEETLSSSKFGDSSDNDADQAPDSVNAQERQEEDCRRDSCPDGVMSPSSPQHAAPMSSTSQQALGITSAVVVDMPLSPTACDSVPPAQSSKLSSSMRRSITSSSSSDKEDSSIEISSSSSSDGDGDDDEPGPTGAESQSRSQKHRRNQDTDSSLQKDQKKRSSGGKYGKDGKKYKSNKTCVKSHPGENELDAFSTHDMYEAHFENSCENSLNQTGRNAPVQNQPSNYHQQNQHFIEEEDEGGNSSPPPADEMALLAMRTLQETLEGNLFCGDSSEYTASRPQSLEEEEYVLSEDEEVNDITSSDESDSDKSSASEGSEDIEPFPPPPPELLEEELPESVQGGSLMPLEESKSELEHSQPIRLAYTNRHADERRQRRGRNRDVPNGDSIYSNYPGQPERGNR